MHTGQERRLKDEHRFFVLVSVTPASLTFPAPGGDDGGGSGADALLSREDVPNTRGGASVTHHQHHKLRAALKSVVRFEPFKNKLKKHVFIFTLGQTLKLFGRKRVCVNRHTILPNAHECLHPLPRGRVTDAKRLQLRVLPVESDPRHLSVARGCLRR